MLTQRLKGAEIYIRRESMAERLILSEGEVASKHLTKIPSRTRAQKSPHVVKLTLFSHSFGADYVS